MNLSALENPFIQQAAKARYARDYPGNKTVKLADCR